MASKKNDKKYIISGYHQFSDGIEVVEIPRVFDNIEDAAQDVSDTINETIASCNTEQEPTTPADCSDGYKFESESGEVIELKIVEVKH